MVVLEELRLEISIASALASARDISQPCEDSVPCGLRHKFVGFRFCRFCLTTS
jgi:hypothetical protein